MTLSHKDVMANLPKERLQKIEEKAKEILEKEMTLRDLRVDFDSLLQTCPVL